ncbi:MAG: hypothetical protein MNSN_05180 [Minisyncoccus archaeiphilus]|nr:MAG: hypothetical protein MNSN_05180 [Candidatus Parcubacteria bacterium]
MPKINESDTRQIIIDKRLASAGWDVKNPSQVTSELDIWVGLPEGVQKPEHEYQGHQFADYALLGDNGYPLAIVEAKKNIKRCKGWARASTTICGEYSKKFWQRHAFRFLY